MWHTNCGDRTLEGAEAKLFAEALWDFVQKLGLDEGNFDVGLEVFDRLTYGQKVYLLSVIGNGLLRPDVPIRKLTSVVEGAIAAVFCYLEIAVIIEIDDGINSNWRKMILAVHRQIDVEYLLDEDCDDEEEWSIQIEVLSYLILWDADYEDEDIFIDSPPEEAHGLQDLMLIRDDYFLEIPDDLKPKEIETTISELNTLCRSVCEKS